MKRWLTAVGLVAVVATSWQPARAQWPQHSKSSAPRTSDGRVNLTAPAPRTPDGKPDLSGVWENPGWRELATNNVSGTGGSPGTPRGLPTGPAQFFDLASAAQGGIPFQPWAADLKKKRMADNSQDNPDAHCLPLGNMQLHTHPDPRKIIQTPSLIVILYEGNGGIRQIFTDGRPLPGKDPQPWWFGYSTGKWEGDTLVVETNGFRDGGWLDVNGTPLTDSGKTIERFRRVDYGSLEVEVTVDDRKAYTRPWTVTVKQRLMPDAELIEFICAENEKSSAHFVR